MAITQIGKYFYYDDLRLVVTDKSPAGQPHKVFCQIDSDPNKGIGFSSKDLAKIFSGLEVKSLRELPEYIAWRIKSIKDSNNRTVSELLKSIDWEEEAISFCYSLAPENLSADGERTASDQNAIMDETLLALSWISNVTGKHYDYNDYA